MHPNQQTIEMFYGAFARLDPQTMARCYAEPLLVFLFFVLFRLLLASQREGLHSFQAGLAIVGRPTEAR